MKTEKEIRNDQARKKAAELREKKRQQEVSASDERLKRAQAAYQRYRHRKQSESQNQVKDRVNQWLEKSKTVSDRYKSRYGSGTDRYRSDSEDWLQEMSAQRDELNREALEIGKFLKDNRSAMGEGFYDYVNSLMHENRGYHSSVVDQAQRERDYYSQWENEDAYNEAMKARQEYEAKRSFDTEAGKQEIARLENDLKVYRDLSRWETDERGKQRLEELKQQYGDEKGIRDLITQKNAYLTEAERIQAGDRLSGVGQMDSGFYEKDFLFLSRPREDIQDVQYRYINDENYRREYQQMLGGNYDNLKEAGLEYLTEDEKRTYNYHYAKGGKEQAQEYLKSIREQLNYRRADEMYQGLEDNTLLEMAFGIEAGIDQWQSGMDSLINNREGDYMAPSARQIASGMVREDLGERSKFAQGAYDLVTTTANMAPSILTSTVANILAPGSGTFVGSAMMGASAGGSAYQEMINQGYSKEQARAYGTLVGASETVLGSLLGGISSLGGHVSGHVIGNLMNKVDNVILRTALKIGGNMLSEGLEEGLQEMLTPWFESVLTGKKYEVASEDVLYASLLGALSAGFLEGPTSVMEAHGVRQQGLELQAANIAPERLAKIGQTFSADTVAYQLAGRVDENTDAYTLGRLFNEIDAELTQLNKDSITSSLMSKGVEERHAKKLADSFAAVVTGASATDVEMMALSMNDVLAQSVREAIIDPNATAYQKNQNFGEVLKSLSESGTEAAPEANPEAAPTAAEETETMPESRYEASAEGKTILKSTGETVGIRDIAESQDGKLRLNLEDGRTVDAGEVAFGSEGEAMVYGAVAELNVHPAAANLLVEGYRLENTDAEVYAKGIQEAFRFGENNYPMSMAAKGPFTSMLTPHQRDVAYQMGQTFGGKRIAKAQAIAKTATVKNTGPGKVHFDGDRTALSERQQASLNALDRVASALGVQIHIFESQVVDGKHVGKNGWFDPSDNSIHIDLYAGEQGKSTMLFTASHELTHFVKKWSPEKFKALSDFLMTEYGKQGMTVDNLVQEQIRFAREKGRTLSQDQAFEEVIANSMESMLSDGKAIEKLEKLKAQDRSLWEKIRDYVKDLAAKIKKIYEDIRPDSEEGKYVSEMKDAIEELQNLFAEGLSEAGRNYQAAMERGAEAQKNTADEGGEVMYHARNSGYDHSKTFYQQLIDFQNGIFPDKDTFVLGGTPDVLKRIGLASLPMTMNQRHVNDALNGTYKGSPQEKLDHSFTVQELAKIPEKIADPIAVIQDKRTGKARASESNVDVIVEMKSASGKQVICAVQIGGNGHVNGLRIDTNKVATVHGNTDSITRLTDAINDNEKGNVSVFYLNNEKTTKVIQSAGNPIPRGLKHLDGFINSIFDSGSPVKSRFTHVTETLQFKRWFGDSKVVNADGTPKVMFHGSPAQFTVFDKKKARSSGHYGRGFYFTDSDSHAGTYGKLYSVYLNIRNPLQNGVSKVRRNQVRAYLEAVAENEDYSIENYGTYDVDEILKTVMGTSGKKDAFQVIQDISATAIGDMVEAAELFNSVNGTEFDGIIVPTETVAFRPEQIKSATDNIGTFDGENPDIRYSERTGEGVSSRAMLADAFEGLAQTDLERKKIQEYREKAAQYDAEEQKLRELRGQIKELSFAKGPRDKKQLLALQTEATRSANRINIYDKQLLRLEASAPLKAVLEREKAKTAQRIKKQHDKAMAEYRAEALRKQESIAKRYQESRKQGIENRNRTAARHKVQRIVDELNQYLLKGTKDRHVPENLQKAVAEALNVVNMDTVGAEERIAKLREELMAAKTPEKIQEISRKIDSVQAMGDRMRDRLQALKNAYAEFIESEDSDIQNAYDDVVVSKMETVIETVGDTPLRDMSITQLEDVYDMYKAVLTVIRNANKAFKAGKNQQIGQISAAVMDEVRGKGKNRKLSIAFMESLRKFGWDNLKPVYAFEMIGSGTLADLFRNVRSGEDAWAQDVSEAREFYRDTARKHNAQSWDRKKRYEFESTSGMSFSLDLEQIMSLYAYSKREQAADHLRRGGIVFDETTEVTVKTKMGIPVKFNPTEATAYNISDVTLGEIVGSLTEEQKRFVDEMQEYLSKTMGAKGNEVSMEMYGIRLFKEKNYFPLKSAQQFMAKAKEQQKGEVKIKNSGFSKATVKHASNPVVLTPFMNVWADHVNEMSMYHAFVLPMEDFYRVYNFKTPTSEVAATESVEMLIQNAFGKGATRYIDQLLKDLNGGARTDPTVGLINKGIATFKKGAVFASASVVIQQPSAVARALAMVDARYFIGKLDKQKHGQLWSEVKKYAPVAIIKEMGYFDTNMGKSTEEFILGKEYGSITEKAKALVTDGNYRDEILSRLPALADEMSWCTIWQAVKRETIDKHPGMMTRNREEFMKIVGKRFTEVIVKTQVYDSVLSRSALMRSKDTGMKMATAFMAEPTTSMNMMADALAKAKQGNGKAARTTIGAVIASQILNAMLVSLVYAARDDDEEKSLTEKYISSVVGKVADSMNPGTYIPFVKDIVSIVQGYDVERSDMSVISDLWNAWQKLDNQNLSAWRKVEGFGGSIAQIFGLPLKNIMRDIRAMWQVYEGIVNGEKTTAAGIRYAIQGALTGKDVSKQKQLYEAEIAGDEEHAARVRARYKDESKAASAMRSEIRDRYESGAIDRQSAMDQLVRLGGMDEDDAYWRVEEWDYALNPDNAEDYSKYGKFYDAVRTGVDLKKTIQAYTDNGVDQKTLISQITGHFKEEYVGKTNRERIAIKGYIVNGFVYCGMSREDALAKVEGWDFHAKYGFDYEDRKAAYRDGKVTAAQLEKILVEIGGLTEIEAKRQVKVYDWQNDGIDISSDQIGIIEDFEVHCEPAGISRDVYYDAYLFYKDSGEEGVSYSKTKECMPYIDSLPLTAKQKTALALCWWAESTVNKYKTW